MSGEGGPTAGDSFHPTRGESDFIASTRFLMIAGLAFHHMFRLPGSEYYPRNSLVEYSHFVPDLINGFVHMSFMAAVPALSVISGFLFFRRPKLDFVPLLKKRFFTVALPTWLWSALWLAFAYVVYLVFASRGWFGFANYHFEDFGPMELVNGVFGVTEEPFAFQFWFVHDLILTLILSPLVYWLLKRLGWIFLVAMAVVWVTEFTPPLFFSFNVLMFFCLGAWLGMPGGPRLETVLGGVRRYGVFVAPLFVLALGLRLFAHETGALESWFLGYQHLCLLRILGVVSFSALLLFIVERDGWLKRALIGLSGYSFFVFATHFPVVEFVKAIARRVPGSDSSIAYFAMLVFVPFVTIGICIIAARLLEKLVPPLFGVLNGGRSLRAR